MFLAIKNLIGELNPYKNLPWREGRGDGAEVYSATCTGSDSDTKTMFFNAVTKTTFFNADTKTTFVRPATKTTFFNADTKTTFFDAYTQNNVFQC